MLHFFSHLFIYPLMYHKYDLLSEILQLFLLGAGQGRWRKTSSYTLECFLSDTLSFGVMQLQATETHFAQFQQKLSLLKLNIGEQRAHGFGERLENQERNQTT